MKLSFLMIMIFLFGIAFAAEDKEDEIPPWMESVDVRGRSTYLVPRGATREIIGSQVIVEPPNVYVARQIYQMEKYLEENLAKIKEEQANLKKELETLKATFNELEIQKELEGLKEMLNEMEQEKKMREAKELERLKETLNKMKMEIEKEKEEISQ